MRRSLGPESAPPRGRRIAIITLILLLIALPLYLWPLRGSGTGLPGAAALSGPPRDPRDAAAVAHLPSDVWDGLMDEGRTGRKGETKHAPGNLTRIAHLEEVPGAGALNIVPGGPSLPWPRDALSRTTTALLGEGSDRSGGSGDSPPAPLQFLAVPPGGDGAGSGNSGGGGGYPNSANSFGPFSSGGGAGGAGGNDPSSFSDPGDPSAPAPTPEPATILLIGSNVALLGAASWSRIRSGHGDGPGG